MTCCSFRLKTVLCRVKVVDLGGVFVFLLIQAAPVIKWMLYSFQSYRNKSNHNISMFFLYSSTRKNVLEWLPSSLQGLNGVLKKWGKKSYRSLNDLLFKQITMGLTTSNTNGRVALSSRKWIYVLVKSISVNELFKCQI